MVPGQLKGDYMPCTGRDPSPDMKQACSWNKETTQFFCCGDDETEAPTTVFEGQNYTIGAPEINFRDADGEFKLDFQYTVGASAENLKFSLFRTGCEDTSDVSNIIITTAETVESSIYVKEISVDKTKIEKSPLFVSEGESQGFSAGSINFCAKAETLAGSISVSFLKTDVSLQFDLTNNTFTVENNGIQADTIGNNTSTISTKYGVDAFRCETSDGKRIDEATELEQNALVGICLEPLLNSTSSVKISNYDMNFTQGGKFVFAAAEFGASAPKKASALSQVTSFDAGTLAESEGTTAVSGVIRHKVVSRLITALFNGEDTQFNVVGNAFLVFKTAVTDQSRNLRQLDDYVEGSAEDSPFSLPVEIKKTASGTSDEEMKSSLVISVVGAALAVTVGFVLYKKLA
eukprot:CAMPEP_0194305536 /NCGR_PEP_ID=MMETSP0171-20130528/2954_1 /TAXON_ID=218684 /ORGANISM="Corethron pennatum, Strain L29A3" /LENGTH=403 /DNA_ID=CAMNT_0039057097 /DNA_START=229 /DNA_END=1440 /DNA_ORIENTATION=-